MLLERPGIESQEDIAEKLRVKELIEFERFCRDCALWEEMGRCYAPDSVVDISWFQGSGHGFVEASSRLSQSASHKIYDTLVRRDGGRAVAVTMSTIEMRLRLDGADLDLLADAKLVFRLEKREGLWLIVAFGSIYEKDALIPVYPQKDFSIDPKDLAGFRPSYAGMSYAMSRQGRRINGDLPGVDRPESAEKLYREAESWLHGR